MKRKLAELLKKVVYCNYNGHQIDLILCDEIEQTLKEYETQEFLQLVVDKSKKTIYRNSPLKDQEVFKNTFKNEIAAGIDMFHYATKVERWSNTKEGIKRSYFGWRDTILNFADADKPNLVMISNQEPDEFDRLFSEV